VCVDYVCVDCGAHAQRSFNNMIRGISSCFIK
jgi:hypothetical protein